jgi:hypothetical protein
MKYMPFYFFALPKDAKVSITAVAVVVFAANLTNVKYCSAHFYKD